MKLIGKLITKLGGGGESIEEDRRESAGREGEKKFGKRSRESSFSKQPRLL